MNLAALMLTLMLAVPAGAQTFFNPGRVAFSGLGTPPNGAQVYCTDCLYGSSPCAGSGSGAPAFRVNGAWRCGDQGGAGDVTDVWSCTGGNCNALTAAAGDTLDAGAADAASPATRSTSLPATCTEGQAHQDTDSGGTEWHLCTATNTWTKVASVAPSFLTVSDETDLTGERRIVAGTGLSGTDGGGNGTYVLATATTEAAFLADGGASDLTCGAAQAGKAQVMDAGPLQWCDGATTSVLRQAPFGNASGDALTCVALAANGANCAGGSWAAGVDASGAAEGCTVDDDVPESGDFGNLTGGAGITVSAGTVATASTEAVFLADGGAANLTCGASQQGKMQVMDAGPVQWCDGATTSVLRNSALAIADGTALAAITLSANGGNCAAGSWAAGVDAVGAAEGCTPDDDVPESGDFGAAVDLEADGSLSIDVVAPAEMADADHGDVSWSGGVATVDSGAVNFSELAGSATDAQVSDAITVDGTDAGTGTTRSNFGKIRLTRHDTNCTSLTDGLAGELCWEEDANALYMCEPTAGGCDTAGEWIGMSGLPTPSADNLLLISLGGTFAREVALSSDFVINTATTPDELENGALTTELGACIGNTAAEFCSTSTMGANAFSYNGPWACESGGTHDFQAGCTVDLAVATISPALVVSVDFGAGALTTDGTQCGGPAQVTLNSGPKAWTILCADNAGSILNGALNLPDSYSGGTVTFELRATNDNASPSGVLDFDFSCQCRGDSDTVNSTWGTAQNAAITFTTQWDEEHATTAATTCDGSCAAGDSLYWRAVMDATATTTQVTDAYILGVKMELPVNALTD